MNLNPLYQQVMGGMPMNAPMGSIPMNAPVMQMPFPQSMNPMQRMSYVMQAMQHPAQFVKQAFPDIPDSISGNPGQILQYLQQTRGITNEQIQQTMNQIPQMQRRW